MNIIAQVLLSIIEGICVGICFGSVVSMIKDKYNASIGIISLILMFGTYIGLIFIK